MAQGGGFQRRGMLSKRRETNPWKVFQSQLPHVQVSLPPLMDQCAPSVFAASNFLFSPPQNNEGHMIMKKGPRKKANQTRQSLPEGYKFAGFDSAQKFPNAKERLHNILQGAAKEHKLNFVSEQVQSGFWKAELQINWPHAMCFCGEGWEKREAEKRAAALACDELEVIDERSGASCMCYSETQ